MSLSNHHFAAVSAARADRMIAARREAYLAARAAAEEAAGAARFFALGEAKAAAQRARLSARPAPSSPDLFLPLYAYGFSLFALAGLTLIWALPLPLLLALVTLPLLALAPRLTRPLRSFLLARTASRLARRHARQADLRERTQRFQDLSYAHTRLLETYASTLEDSLALSRRPALADPASPATSDFLAALAALPSFAALPLAEDLDSYASLLTSAKASWTRAFAAAAPSAPSLTDAHHLLSVATSSLASPAERRAALSDLSSLAAELAQP